MTDRLALCIPLTAARIARLEAADLTVVGTQGGGDCPDGFRTARFALGNPPARWIAASPGLEWLQLESVGFGEYLSLPPGGPSVTNLAGLFADPVAESALAGILALNRGIDRLALVRKDATWLGDDLRPELRLLTGASLVLFGMGAINRRLAQLLTPFNCRITAFHADWRPAALDAAVSQADIVACAAPGIPTTSNVFDARRLSALPTGALFVNFGRGSLLDEGALAEALVGNRLRGAVIDVTRDEPLPPDHPFWTAPRLILTQHSGGGSSDETDRKIDVFLANLTRFRTGQALQGLVDFSKGY